MTNSCKSLLDNLLSLDRPNWSVSTSKELINKLVFDNLTDINYKQE